MTRARLVEATRERLAAIEAAGLLAARGHAAQSARRLAALVPDCRDDPTARDALARALFHARRFAEAAALVEGVDQPAALAARAASLLALGDLAGAEATYDDLIARWPAEAPAWCNRATLRRWSASDNHVEALERAFSRADAEARIPLSFALAKELEDLGRHADSFGRLAQGAALRRARLSYRVEADVEGMAAIAGAFNSAAVAGGRACVDAPGPIFVLGLPRSGTTLVDRILSSHSRVVSLGEIPDVAMALMETTPRQGDRAAFVAAAAAADPGPFAARLTERLAGYEAGDAVLLDKTPVNFLYAGLLARALPAARIVHVRRAPMDVGYALFKTLFQTGCPYSYEQTDIGRYLVAQSRLMAHWRRVLPGRMIEVDYEALVDDLPGEARRLVAACGLPWEAACLDFHANRQPSATASAAQVRRPLYRDSVGLWRRYEAELAPLREVLGAEGLA